MKYSQYKFRFYFNASHEVFLSGKWGEKHSHTWEIMIHTVKMQSEFIEFNKVEEKIKGFLEQFEGCHLNERSPFDTINPTLENCSEYFAEYISNVLKKESWILLMLEMSETPSRSCVINLLEDRRRLYSQDIDREAESVIHELFEANLS